MSSCRQDTSQLLQQSTEFMQLIEQLSISYPSLQVLTVACMLVWYTFVSTAYVNKVCYIPAWWLCFAYL